MKRYIPTLFLALLSSGAFAGESVQAPAAEEVTVVETVTVRDSTINALDYVLQRPAPARTFESKRFGDHLFLNAYAGPDWSRSNVGTLTGGQHRPGGRLGLSIGDWVTPVHGWRVSLEAGKHQGLNGNRPWFGAISADYLMNLSNLLRGENPSRRFELVGLLGMEFDLIHQSGLPKDKAFGVRMGLQPRFYFTPTTYIFLEPRLGIFTDGIDAARSWHRHDWNASFLIGFGYRMNPRKGFKVDNSLFENDSFGDNMFFGVGGGVNLLGSSINSLSSRLGPVGNVFVGKWFNATSGLRLSASGAKLRQPSYTRRWAGWVDVDYMWNINSSFNGFDPDRKTDLNLALGASLAGYTGKGGRKIVPAFHVGLQGAWNVTRNFSLFIEPDIHLLAKKVEPKSSNHTNLLSSLSLGLIYRTGGGAYRRNAGTTFDYSDFLESKRFFVEGKAGVFMRSQSWHSNEAVAISLGRWFSPGSAWRVSGEYDYMNVNRNYRSISASVDYIGSLSTLAAGWNDERVFDLSVFFGLTAGGAHYSGKYNELVWGPRAGIRAAFRLSSAVDLLIEPRVQVMSIPHLSRRFTPEGFVMAGLSYKFGTNRAKKGMKDDSELHNDDWSANFASLSGGPSLFSETIVSSKTRRVDWTVDASAGHWFNQVSGLQAGLSYDFIDRGGRNASLSIGTVHADYLLNLTALALGNRGKTFNLIGLAGIGLGWSNRNNGHLSPAVEAGLQANVRVAKGIYLTFTPTMTFWRPVLNQGRGNNHHFIGVGRMPVGIQYMF